MFNFWQKWLVGVGIYISIVGLLIGLNLSPEFIESFTTPVFFKDKFLAENIRPFQSWIYGVLGATLIGFGIMVTFIGHFPFKQKEKWARNCIFFASLSWYCLDTIISIKANAHFNVILNTAFLALLLFPIIFTVNDFKQTK